MAQNQFFHNSLNEEQTNELVQRMKNAESETMKIYELAKIFKTLWRRKAHQLYIEIYGDTSFQPEEAGRALSDLCCMGYLTDTCETVKEIKGAPNKIYRLADVEPINPIKIPKKITVPLQFIETSNGNYELDLEKMSQEFISKLDYWDNILSPQTVK
jgi:hypothetical protein